MQKGQWRWSWLSLNPTAFQNGKTNTDYIIFKCGGVISFFSRFSMIILKITQFLPQGGSTLLDQCFSEKKANNTILCSDETKIDGNGNDSCPISTWDLWSSFEMTIGFFVTSLTKEFLPRLLSLAGWPTSGYSCIWAVQAVLILVQYALQAVRSSMERCAVF